MAVFTPIVAQSLGKATLLKRVSVGYSTIKLENDAFIRSNKGSFTLEFLHLPPFIAIDVERLVSRSRRRSGIAVIGDVGAPTAAAHSIAIAGHLSLCTAAENQGSRTVAGNEHQLSRIRVENHQPSHVLGYLISSLLRHG